MIDINQLTALDPDAVDRDIEQALLEAREQNRSVTTLGTAFSSGVEAVDFFIRTSHEDTSVELRRGQIQGSDDDYIYLLSGGLPYRLPHHAYCLLPNPKSAEVKTS